MHLSACCRCRPTEGQTHGSASMRSRWNGVDRNVPGRQRCPFWDGSVLAVDWLLLETVAPSTIMTNFGEKQTRQTQTDKQPQTRTDTDRHGQTSRHRHNTDTGQQKTCRFRNLPSHRAALAQELVKGAASSPTYLVVYAGLIQGAAVWRLPGGRAAAGEEVCTAGCPGGLRRKSAGVRTTQAGGKGPHPLSRRRAV